MTHQLFYTSLAAVSGAGALVTFEGEEASHIARSLRARPGDVVLAGDRRGTLCVVELESVGRDCVRGRVLSTRRCPRERPEITVFQALGKAARVDEAVAGTAESGVARLVPFVSCRSPESARARRDRLDRWRRIAGESSKVARRPWAMEVAEPLPGLPGPRELPGDGPAVLLWEGENARSLAAALPDDAPREIAFLVGPEGGFSEREAGELASAGAVAASLGDLIVRAQTAGAYASMIARYRYGLLNPKLDGPGGG